MADSQSEERPGGGPPRGRTSRVARRAVTLLFWCCSLYVAAVGFYSITSQVFWPRASARAPEVGCAEGVVRLRAELLARASERVAATGHADDPGLQRWLRDWDERHAALGASCDGPGARAHASLGRLRHRVETGLLRWEREHAPLVRDIEQGLTRASD